MANDYISREDAIEVINEGRLTKLIDADVAESGLKDLPAADVVSKADLKTLLEQTEKELVKDTDKYSIAYNFIVSVIGIIKCKINMMGEKTDD